MKLVSYCRLLFCSFLILANQSYAGGPKAAIQKSRRTAFLKAYVQRNHAPSVTPTIKQHNNAQHIPAPKIQAPQPQKPGFTARCIAYAKSAVAKLKQMIFGAPKATPPIRSFLPQEPFDVDMPSPNPKYIRLTQPQKKQTIKRITQKQTPAPQPVKKNKTSKKTTPQPKKQSSTVEYMRVQQQKPKSNDCALHALYNGWKQYSTFLGRQIPQFPLATWRTYITDLREGYTKNTMLNDEDITELADYAGINQDTYTIIQDIAKFQLTAEQLQFYSFTRLIHMPHIVERLRTQNGYAHIFIIGDMEHYENRAGKTRWTNGHWIAILAYRQNNTIHYVCMDSGSGKPVEKVNKLRQLIEQSDLAGITAIVNTIKAGNAAQWDE